MTHLQIGQTAPDFSLNGHDGARHMLSQLRGKPVILAFYPHDFSPTCTQEHACLTREMARFNDLNAQVFGLSTDSTWAHKAYAAQQGISYPLLADYHPQGAVARLYGVFDEERGRANRITFVIAPDGRIAYIQRNEAGQVPPVDDLLETLESFKSPA